jgi:hypothetical protein
MVVLSTRYNLLRGNSSGWNKKVKRVGGGVVWGWVTDREVWPRLKFDQILNVISVKNILIERLASQTISKIQKNWNKKFRKFQTFFEKIINSGRICRRGYAEGKAVGIDYTEGRSYADGQIELHRGASTPRGYAEGSPRHRLRWRQLYYTPRVIGRQRLQEFL